MKNTQVYEAKTVNEEDSSLISLQLSHFMRHLSPLMLWQNKLECLTMATTSSLA